MKDECWSVVLIIGRLLLSNTNLILGIWVLSLFSWIVRITDSNHLECFIILYDDGGGSPLDGAIEKWPSHSCWLCTCSAVSWKSFWSSSSNRSLMPYRSSASVVVLSSSIVSPMASINNWTLGVMSIRLSCADFLIRDDSEFLFLKLFSYCCW